MYKIQFLDRWANNIALVANAGKMANHPISLVQFNRIAGPRAAALEIIAGFDSGQVVKALSANDCALLRQTIPWQFEKPPACYMSGRCVRVEASWPDGLSETTIRLSKLNTRPYGNGRWCVGKNELGATVSLGLSDSTPHFLVAGTTGSGKSVTLKSAALQLAQDEMNQVVLMDGKYGESLKPIENLPSVVGPVATTLDEQRSALAWMVSQMRQRYESDNKEGHLIGIFDEFQEASDDDMVASLLRKLSAQGRAANVHLILATHHPTVDAFGDRSTRRLLVGKLALHVDDYESSRVAVGGRLPRADYLLGAGDAYAVSPSLTHRVQVAYVDAEDWQDKMCQSWIVDNWDFESDIGQDLPVKEPQYTEQEITNAMLAGITREGRPTFKRRFENPPGSNRAGRLLRLGKSVWSNVSQSNELTDWIAEHTNKD